MKIKLLAAAVSIVPLSWLGLSFATPSDVPIDPELEFYLGGMPVSGEHPDSHRLGAWLEEDVALPRWDVSEADGAEFNVLALREQ